MSRTRFATIDDLATALSKRRVSAGELATESLRLLALLGDSHHALAALLTERALDAAGREDVARAGRATGPLAGIPFGVKELIADDARVVRRLADHGAVLVARLAVENGGSGWAAVATAARRVVRGESLGGVVRPLGRNPWCAERWSGGSSSGPAIAVAAGALPFALATETSGSIAVPASFCGLTGLRPTRGSVSLQGVTALTNTLDTVGVLAHTAADCATVLRALLVRPPMPAEPGPRIVVGRPHRAPLRIGRLAGDLDHAAPVARAALAAGLAEIIAGSEALFVVLPEVACRALVATVMAAEGSARFAALVRSDALAHLVSPHQAAGLLRDLAVPASAYRAVQRERGRLRRAFAQLFTEVDLLVAPTHLGTAPPREVVLRRRDGSSEEALPLGSTLVPAGCLAGLPAVFVPCGLGTDGLPVGVQLVGPPRSEPLLLEVAADYQRRSSHHRLRPPVGREGCAV